MGANLYCSKCGRTMDEKNFYTLRTGSKSDMCKACETMHINNWEPDTFTWLLKKYDVPYIPSEWNVLRDKAYQKDPYKITGMSVFGKYLSKMRLNQWKNYRWDDTEELQKEEAEKAALTKIPEEKIKEMEEAFERGEISEAQLKTYKDIEKPAAIPMTQHSDSPYGKGPSNPYPVNANPYEEVDLIDVGADLTKDDKIYLAMKWGQLYTAAEWISLEQLYNDFMNSFDIQGAARIDTLKMICKTSLKMNQAIDSGDVESYQKLSRVYDAMMKSAKFTEAQNKDGDTADFDSVGLIVQFAEKEGGFIEEYKVDVPLDTADVIIQDNKDYLRALVDNDPNISQLIEQHLKKLEIQAQQKEDKKKAKEQGLDNIILTDDDYKDFYEDIQEQKEQDIEVIAEDEEE